MIRLIKNILLLVPVFYFPQKPLIPVKIENKWGFMDENKKLVIPAQYDQAYPFAEYKIFDKEEKKYKNVSLAKVFEKKNMKCILSTNINLPCTNLSSNSENSATSVFFADEDEILRKKIIREDEDRKIIDDFQKKVPDQFEGIKIITHTPLFFEVKKNNKFGVANESGDIIVPINFDFTEPKSFTNQQRNQEIYFIGKFMYPSDAPTEYFSRNGKLLLKSYMPYFPILQSGTLIKVQDKEGNYIIYNIQERKFINKKSIINSPQAIKMGIYWRKGRIKNFL
ncbi:hypothetical protein ASG31_18070 [Chryseobacterium sp. Leaf404]|uniref:WG repeat-containing protein n=1 Tax=unclassified Chryseobacterium TaxID=2593645 RepID=UPI00070018D3|nr:MULTISPECIES: WG repeat-containing protein [unclassified Chryseobacterium]KQT19284.1 hypothetical protein ASG31_18070 [Chryseobacterium sp. Leaf404]